MAKHDQRSIVRLSVQSRKFGRHASHRHQFGACNPRQLKLARLADIDERELLAGLQSPLHFLWCDLEWQGCVAQLSYYRLMDLKDAVVLRGPATWMS